MESGSEEYHCGVHILGLDGGDFVVTGSRIGTLGSAVTRFDREGKVVWSRAVEDNFISIEPERGRQEYANIVPHFSIETSDNRVVFVGQTFHSWGGRGLYYQIHLNAKTGKSLDTIAGLKDGVSTADRSVVVTPLSDGGFWSADYYDLPNAENAFQLYCRKLSPTVSTDLDTGRLYAYHTPGTEYFSPQGYDPRAMIETSSGDVVVFGGAVAPLETLPYQIPFLMKMSSIGEEIWSRNPAQYGDGNGIAFAVDTAQNGGFLAAYRYAWWDSARPQAWVPTDAVVMRLDSLGEFLWDWHVGDSSRRYVPSCVRELPNGGVVVCGYVGGVLEGGFRYDNNSEQMFLARIRKGGELVWFREWGDEGTSDRLEDMIVLPDGDVLVTGVSNSKLYLARIGSETASVNERERLNLELDLSGVP